MTEVIMSSVIGYGFGQLNPAALISAIKKKDLRVHGTGNLGATNTFLVFGKVYGIAVMIFDVLKAYLAIQIVKQLFPMYRLAGLFAGCFAVIGHVFPCYLHFKGGKGVAAFAGMILAYDVKLLLFLLAIAVILMLITNKGYWGPISAAVLFPLYLLIRYKNILVYSCVAAAGGLIIWKHKINLARAKEGGEILVNEFSGTCKKIKQI